MRRLLRRCSLGIQLCELCSICVRAPRSFDNITGRSQPCGMQISWPKSKLMAITPNPTTHLPLKICNKEVKFVDSFTYLGSLITNGGSSSHDITSRIAMCHPSKIPHQRKNQDQHVSRPGCLCFALWVWILVHHRRRSPPLTLIWHALPKALRVCSGSSTLTIKASVNVPRNQPNHLSYDNAAYAGSDISSAGLPPWVYDFN